MRFTLDWLSQHLDFNASLEQVSETLTNIGLEVEELEDRGAAYAPFKVAYVESAEKHPDADKLQVLKVRVADSDQSVQVVCGAPNARAGMKGIFAPSGTYIPGLDVTLKKSKIRGVESNGMMVSEKEMCLSDEHKGIIEVDDSLDIGTPMAEIYGLDDSIIEIAVTPNRADCACVRGIARDLAAAGLGTLKPLPIEKVEGTFESPISVEIQDKNCDMFLGRYIKNVKNGPSPKWLQDRLNAVGLRPISALVDITNLMTLDVNRPLHVYDADKLNGNIHVRSAADGETLEALNDKSYTLMKDQVVICDDNAVLGLGGIVGGTETGCTEETKNVFLECALFNPERNARTGRDLLIDTDARYRFDRGVDAEFSFDGIELATKLILEICGGEASSVVQAGEAPDIAKEITMDFAHPKKLIGIDVSPERQEEIFVNLGFDVVAKTDKEIIVKSPSWRHDMAIPQDLVEEVARIHGYDKLPELSIVNTGITQSAESPMLQRTRVARSALAAQGYNECVTYSFMREDKAALFGSNDNGGADQLKLINPISTEWNQMRPSILPNLIDAASNNVDRSYDNVALFEVGPVYRSSKSDGQEIVATGIRQGQLAQKHWSSNEITRDVDLYDAKADLIAVLEALGAPTDNLRVNKDAADYFHPGRSATLSLGKNIIAAFGELHPQVLEDMDIKGPVVGFEVFLKQLPPQKKKSTTRSVLRLNPLQPLKRDFAFVVDQSVAADEIVRAAMAVDKNLIANVDIFDVYQGKGVDDGKKSIAISVTLQPEGKSLTDQDIEAVSQKIVDMVANKTKAELRA